MSGERDGANELRAIEAGIDRCAEALKRGARALVLDRDAAPSVDAMTELTTVLLRLAEIQSAVAAEHLRTAKQAAAAIAPTTTEARKLNS